MADREALKREIDILPEDTILLIQDIIIGKKFDRGTWKIDTDYLSSIPGMAESIAEAANTPPEEVFDTLE